MDSLTSTIGSPSNKGQLISVSVGAIGVLSAKAIGIGD